MPSCHRWQVLFKMDNSGNGDFVRWKHVLSSDGVESGGLDFVEWTPDQVRTVGESGGRACRT